MDWIAFASVVTSGVVGIGGLVAALWSTQKNAALAREGRVHERRIDAYLELLQLIEQRTLWYETLYGRLALVGDVYAKQPALPPEPKVGELATINTLLAAFGTQRLKQACSGWLAAVQKFEEAHDGAEWNWHEDYAGPETPTNPRDLEALRRHVAKVSAERASIEVVISDEIERIQSGVELGPRQLSSSVTQLPPAE